MLATTYTIQNDFFLFTEITDLICISLINKVIKRFHARRVHQKQYMSFSERY